MLRVITMTAYRRPDYTRQVLAALARCHGIADWLLLPHVEPGNDDVIAAFEQWQACESRPVINPERLGLNRNTNAAVERAIRLRADVAVHLEDDTVPAPDALHYFDWAVKTILAPNRKSSDGHQIMLASGYHKPANSPAANETFACKSDRPVWTPWGWAVDRTRLVWIHSRWCFRNPKCFTCRFKATYRATRREVYPLLSRIQNIGYEMGENDRTPEWYASHHRTPHVAGDLIPGNFHLR